MSERERFTIRFSEFQENIRKRLLALQEILQQDPACLAQPDSPRIEDFHYQFNRLVGSLGIPDMPLGTDFFEEPCPDEEQTDWFFSGGREYLLDFGLYRNKSKLGRLGGVVAMHPRRDEIEPIIREAREELMVNRHVWPHIARLLTHKDGRVCEKFALEVLRRPKSFSFFPRNIDGTASFISWTYGPYLLNALQETGATFDDFIKYWLAKKSHDERNRGNARYPGIEYLYDTEQPSLNFLTESERDPSHALADLIVRLAILPNLGLPLSPDK